MERLTKRDSKGRAYFDNNGVLLRGANGVFHQKKDMTAHYIHDRFVALDKALDRLAAYEDTGLEPEEVVQTKLALMGKVLAEIKEFEGVPVDRMIELSQAEKDGRLVMLPCKPDESAYQWKAGDDIPSLFRFDGININEDGEVVYQTHWGETFTLDDFGKTIFLTREEAEAALKKRKEADNETVR